MSTLGTAQSVIDITVNGHSIGTVEIDAPVRVSSFDGNAIKLTADDLRPQAACALRAFADAMETGE